MVTRRAMSIQLSGELRAKIGLATAIADQANSFAAGWNYFFKYAIVLANNLTAAGLIIQYWRPDLNVGIWITVFGVVIVAINVSLTSSVRRES